MPTEDGAFTLEKKRRVKNTIRARKPTTHPINYVILTQLTAQDLPYLETDS